PRLPLDVLEDLLPVESVQEFDREIGIGAQGRFKLFFGDRFCRGHEVCNPHKRSRASPSRCRHLYPRRPPAQRVTSCAFFPIHSELEHDCPHVEGKSSPYPYCTSSGRGRLCRGWKTWWPLRNIRGDPGGF